MFECGWIHAVIRCPNAPPFWNPQIHSLCPNTPLRYIKNPEGLTPTPLQPVFSGLLIPSSAAWHLFHLGSLLALSEDASRLPPWDPSWGGHLAEVTKHHTLYCTVVSPDSSWRLEPCHLSGVWEQQHWTSACYAKYSLRPPHPHSPPPHAMESAYECWDTQLSD